MTDTIDKEIEKHINELEKRIMINGMHPVIHDIDPNAAWIIDRAEWEIFKKKILADRQHLEDENESLRGSLKIAHQDMRSRAQKQSFFNKQLKSFELENTLLRKSTDIRIIEKDKEIERLEECDICNSKTSVHLCRECYNNKPTLTAENIIREYENPYPKDIFLWTTEDTLDFNRGRFNRHCFEIVENMRRKLLEALANKSASLPAGSLAKPKKEETITDVFQEEARREGMNEEMKKRIRNQLSLVKIWKLCCSHDSKKPCRMCMNNISGDVSGIRGNVTGIIGDVTGITGDVTGISGDVSGIIGNVTGIIGDVTGISGDVSGIIGDVSGIRGNVSGIRGNVTGITGDVTGISGDVEEIKKALATKKPDTEEVGEV